HLRVARVLHLLAAARRGADRRDAPVGDGGEVAANAEPHEREQGDLEAQPRRPHFLRPASIWLVKALGSSWLTSSDCRLPPRGPSRNDGVELTFCCAASWSACVRSAGFVPEWAAATIGAASSPAARAIFVMNASVT